MSKINYRRGETRATTKNRTPEREARRRHRRWVRKARRVRRGKKGLLRAYRGLLPLPPNNWCPCCLESWWDRNTRGARSRRYNKRIVHRVVRQNAKHQIRAGLQDMEDTKEDS